MLYVSLPNDPHTTAYLAAQRTLPYTYQPVGASREATRVAHFDHDELRTVIGQGAADFAAAKQAVQRWQMFPAGWTRIVPLNAPIAEGTVVAMYARFFGLWWRNACRIVYTIDEPTRYGFAYGTLPGHVERGEELFLVEMAADGRVSYLIRAFSKPRHWLVRLGYPVVRVLQARFRRDSARQMAQMTRAESVGQDSV